MTTPTAVTAAYIHALMGAMEPDSAAGRKLGDWLRFHQASLRLDYNAALAKPGKANRTPPANGEALSPKKWHRLREAVAKLMPAEKDAPDTALANLAAFAAALRLDAVETGLLRFVFHCDRDGKLRTLCRQLVETRQMDSSGIIAAAAGLARSEVDARLRGGPLRSLGLIDGGGDGATQFVHTIAYTIWQALLPPNSGLADVERALIGAPAGTGLGWDDFAHVAAERDFAARLLEGAVKQKTKGVNILLYGAPGTGKTELCKALAARMGAQLFAIGELDSDGGEPSRYDRLNALRLADRLTARRGKSLLLFDEMEDILQHGERMFDGRRWQRRSGSKVFFNRLLEENATPILWTANSLWEFDSAFLRRMTFVFEMRSPSMKTRRRLWQGAAARHGLELAPDTADSLARLHKLAPSFIRCAAAAVALAGGTADELEFVVTSLRKPYCGRQRTLELPDVGRFDAALSNADADLAALETALSRNGAPRDVSLCLYGPPGTGKTAFARRLAEKMGLDPLVKRASDLLSMWVGATEQRIAEAFEEAAQDERFLIIDEADSLLWSRGSAERAWEASMVNELLTQMEAHRWPFACTTNQMDRVDPAALRRFSFKVKFDFLTKAQTVAAYRHYFADEPPAALAELTALTPGDFAVVARKLRFHSPEERKNGIVLQLLQQEVAIKPGQKRRIGF
ncbi:MAG: AAA family ATPase [Dongiaceae bacterium]